MPKAPIDYEYTQFGDAIQRRKAGSTDDWEDVPEDGMADALVELRADEKMRERVATQKAARAGVSVSGQLSA